MQQAFWGLQGYGQHIDGDAQCRLRTRLLYLDRNARTPLIVILETLTPIVDNHMICTIRLGDRYIFLDATDPKCVSSACLPKGYRTKQALVATGDSTYLILTVPVPGKRTRAYPGGSPPSSN